MTTLEAPPSVARAPDRRARDPADNPRQLLALMPAPPAWRAAAKRAIDVTLAAVAIIGLAPLLVGIAVAIRVTAKGEVLFRQTRVGHDGRLFTCLKFRTMRHGSHLQQEQLRSRSIQDGPAFKVPDDPRVTAIGRQLRKYSLDELPQLFNVLVGDMSLVGPRPPTPSEVATYSPWQRQRLAVRPGLTCIWQVYGRNRVSFERWIEMDLQYIAKQTLWLDCKLIAHTFRVVARGTGM